MSTKTTRTQDILDRTPSSIALYRLLVPFVIVGLWELLSRWIGPRVLPGPVHLLSPL